MRVQVVDPSAYTRPYDHALCAALATAGAEVELITSAFAYGTAPVPDGYRLRELFYRRASGPAGSRVRQATKLAEHVPDMLRYRRAATATDVVHFQWLTVQWVDRHLLPRRPVVLTAHDLLPREPRPMQARAQRRLYETVDAVVVHSAYGRGLLVDEVGVAPSKVHVVPHGAFEHLTELEGQLPAELGDSDRPVVLFFGLLRPYKGIDALLDAWRQSKLGARAELWIVGRPRMSLEPLLGNASGGVRLVPRFVPDGELAACFRRAEVVVLPYSRTERLDFSGVLATALAFGKATVLTDVGAFSEVAAVGAARLVPADDPAALGGALTELIDDPVDRERLAAGAREAAAGPYSWAEAARRSLALYARLID
jgi:glycosyltransferase involved in cell wall biosynthesis